MKVAYVNSGWNKEKESVDEVVITTRDGTVIHVVERALDNFDITITHEEK